MAFSTCGVKATHILTKPATLYNSNTLWGRLRAESNLPVATIAVQYW